MGRLVAPTWTQLLEVFVIVCIRLDRNRFQQNIKQLLIVLILVSFAKSIPIKLNMNDYSDV